MIRRATKTAGRSGVFSTSGAVVTAAASSACCWLPLLLIGFGASAASVSAFFEQWRPYLAVVAVAFLAVAFWQVYFRASACAAGACNDNACDTGFRRRGFFPQVMLWTSAALVASFVLFPNYGGIAAEALYGDANKTQSTVDTSMTTARFDIKGMTCEACAVSLRADLSKIPGVDGVEVDYPSASAVIQSSQPNISEQVEATAKRHGYTATPLESDD